MPSLVASVLLVLFLVLLLPMTWGVHSTDIVPYSSPYRPRHAYYPHYHRDYRADPYRSSSRSRRARRNSRHAETEKAWERSLDALREPDVPDRRGDLGWTLEYATAWAYRNLIGNSTEVADAIDRVRELADYSNGVKAETPFIIFDYLNRAIFGGKLSGMVYMGWKRMASFSPGVTSAPSKNRLINRISIELNKTPFEDGGGTIDQLLDALIHHMIHAYFLVACGHQRDEEKQDGRLQDGLHFGVLLYTIQDITKDCQDGKLKLMFYAAKRREAYLDRGPTMSHLLRGFKAIHHAGSAVVAAPKDGQTHCHHDNRKIRYAEIYNWQVEGYSVAIDLDMESKGDTIYDLGPDGKLHETERLKGPPSIDYIELIWDKKRVMVRREHAVEFPSIKRPLEKDSKMELKLPECSFDVFKHVYDFFNTKSYLAGAEMKLLSATPGYRVGPPVISGRNVNSPAGVVVQLQVFKVAEAMKFEELQDYVLNTIWRMPTTDDDPMSILKHLYNEKENTGPVHAELHKWARSFLARIDDNAYSGMPTWSGMPAYSAGYTGAYHGASNYHKICWLQTEDFQNLIARNSGLKDDCTIVQAQLLAQQINPIAFQPSRPNLPASTDTEIASITQRETESRTDIVRHTPRGLGRSRSLYDPWSNRISSPLSDISSLGSRDDAWLGRPQWDRYQRPWALDFDRRPLALPAPQPYRYYGRDGRFKMRDPLTGDIFARGRSLWDD